MIIITLNKNAKILNLMVYDLYTVLFIAQISNKLHITTLKLKTGMCVLDKEFSQLCFLLTIKQIIP